MTPADIDEGISDPRRYVLVLYQGNPAESSSITTNLVMNIRRKLEDEIDASRDNVEIDLWLESGGGDPHSAYKLAILLRAYAHRLRVVVPDYAKSAATLLTLAADEIFLAPGAELGPLDAQVVYEQGGLNVSALDIVRSLEHLGETAMTMALTGGVRVLQTTRLSRGESMSNMLDFAAKFMQPIVSKLDPTMIHWSSSLLEVAVEYAQRLLSMRDPEVNRKALDVSSLPRALVEEYPTHGFVISRDEARRLRLPVRDLAEYDLAKVACELHRGFEDGGTNLVELLGPVGDDFLGEGAGDDEGKS